MTRFGTRCMTHERKLESPKVLLSLTALMLALKQLGNACVFFEVKTNSGLRFLRL